MISIIIPVFNQAPYIRSCIDSILSQTESDIEIVCVDDGSTDSSGAILDLYAMKDARIKVVHQQNGGVVVARNEGLRASSGDWIWFVDGDDIIAPFAINRLNEILRAAEFDILKVSYLRHVPDIIDTRCSITISNQISVSSLIERVKKTPIEILGMCIGNKIYRRSVVIQAFADVGAIHIKHSEDGLFAFAALMKSNIIAFSSDVVYCYIERADSALHRFNAEIIEERELFISELQRLFKNSRYFSQDVWMKMTAYHSYESIVYIVMSLLRRPPERAMSRKLAVSLSGSWMVELASSELRRKFRRRCFGWVVRHPSALELVGGVVRVWGLRVRLTK